MRPDIPPHAVPLLKEEGFSLERKGRFLVFRLKTPHLTLSTSMINGGQSQRVGYLVNHQSCEGKGHLGRHAAAGEAGREEYHRQTCAEAEVPPGETALMGTAANMQNASVRKECFEETAIWAVVTAGVQGNAGRAGDAAAWHEGAAAWQPVHAVAGTINTVLLCNWPLLPAALARAVATMTEAKTAVLQELSVPSRYSQGLATGTGTDQFCLAAPLDSLRSPKTWTGKHSKLGEIIAKAVMGATREALLWQNGLEPSRTRNLIHALGRFGLTDAGLLASAGGRLEEKDRILFEANLQAILHEPQTAGAAFALAAVADRLAHGVLPPGAAGELLLNQAALMAASLAAKPEAFAAFRAALAAEAEGAAEGSGTVPDLAVRALALGWREKWT